MNACHFSTDPLDRMRRYPNTTIHAPDLIHEGIAEIERLRKLLAEASDEAQLARSTITDLTIEVERLRNELARYKRMYCRSACRDLYASGVRWRIRPNPMRTDGVFIEEHCEPGRNRTSWAFPIQFAHDDAEEIVALLNRAADELEGQGT